MFRFKDKRLRSGLASYSTVGILWNCVSFSSVEKPQESCSFLHSYGSSIKEVVTGLLPGMSLHIHATCHHEKLGHLHPSSHCVCVCVSSSCRDHNTVWSFGGSVYHHSLHCYCCCLLLLSAGYLWSEEGKKKPIQVSPTLYVGINNTYKMPWTHNIYHRYCKQRDF